MGFVTKVLVFVLGFSTLCRSAKILIAIPVPSYTHQMIYRQLFEELANRGHEITLLTTNPINDKNSLIKEISWQGVYDILEKYNFPSVLSSRNYSALNVMLKTLACTEIILEYEMCHPEVQKILSNGERFDLVISEFIITAPLAIAYKLNIPYMGMTTMDSTYVGHDSVGNPSHPVASPDYNVPVSYELSFKDRIISFLHAFISRLMDKFHKFVVQDRVIKKCVGNVPPIEDLQKNISLLLINAHPVFDSIRALAPATINVGGTGIHMPKPKPLPKHLQDLLDGAEEGAIYFSLGTNVRSDKLNERTIQTILEAFSELPYTVLWKFEDENIEGTPKNLHTAKWLPQQDILRHPNVRLFINQGGVHSMEEAILSCVPMIGIPFFGDQFTNVKKMVAKGFGLSLDIDNLRKDTFKQTIVEVIRNSVYKEKVTEAARIILDQPMSGLEKAVWWIEYVIRNRGARHLRNPVVDLPLYQYYLLDVLSFLTMMILMVLLIVYFLFKLAFRINKFNYFQQFRTKFKKNKLY